MNLQRKMNIQRTDEVTDRLIDQAQCNVIGLGWKTINVRATCRWWTEAASGGSYTGNDMETVDSGRNISEYKSDNSQEVGGQNRPL